MSAFETVKQNFENITGYGKPTDGDAKGTLRVVEPQQFRFAADGKVPNNPRLPLLVYKNAVTLDDRFDPAAIFETLFAANAWGGSWRNGIFPYVHYHASIHEVLGIARGSARVRFGGTEGVEIEIVAGDVAVLPAGTAHQRLAMSDDLLVVGAYPPQGEYDECRGRADEYTRAGVTIAQTPLPTRDPLYGLDGPLGKLWRP